MNCSELILDDYRQLQFFAINVGMVLGVGDVVGFVGEVAAGKTTFCRMIGYTKGVLLASPTYGISYKIKQVMHVDMYRVPGDLQILEYIYTAKECLVLVEWYDHEYDVLLQPRIVIHLYRHCDKIVLHIYYYKSDDNIIKIVELFKD